MLSGRIAGAACILALTLALAACLPPDPSTVKEVLENKDQYLKDNFSLDSVPEKVRPELAAAEGEPVKFERMLIHVKPVVEYPYNTEAKPELANTELYLNAGKGFVQRRSELFRNGLPTEQSFQLSYRGLVSIRTQTVPVGSKLANYVMGAKSVQKFDPLTPVGAGPLEYKMKYGIADQVGGRLTDGYLKCSWGETRPASSLAAKFTGQARELDCESINSNGVQTNRSQQFYLLDYGLSLITRIETANYKTTFNIVDVNIQ